MTDDHHVAVVGLAIRCPGALDEDDFWGNLRDGVESVESFEAADLEVPERFRALGQGGLHVPAGGVLEDADRFDAAFFGISPAEARILDPQQRQFVEVAWQAFENAGIVPGPDPATAVFAGAGMPTYLMFTLWDSPALGGPSSYQVTVGNDKDHLATRVAHALDLTGPALTVQTACSTSLVCVHLACQSLLTGECDVALAGGAAIAFPQRRGYYYVEDGILSPDGHCRPMDERAAGTVPGNGVAAVVLRRLADAARRVTRSGP